MRKLFLVELVAVAAALAFSVSDLLAAESGSAEAAVSQQPGEGAADTAARTVIIGFSEPPVAELRRRHADEVRGRAVAADQRARLRRRISALENQSRVGRGLPPRAEAAILRYE